MNRFKGVKMEGRQEIMTELELDSKLESTGQLQVRQLVQSMPDEPVSMAWRSSLNERVMASIEAKRRKRRAAWFLSPALGLGLAGALAFVVLTKPTVGADPQPKASASIEAQLVASHQDTIRYYEGTGIGLSQDEVVNGKSSVSGISSDYGEVDLASL